MLLIASNTEIETCISLEKKDPKRSVFISLYPFLAGCKQQSLIQLGLIHVGNPFDPSHKNIILSQDNLQVSI